MFTDFLKHDVLLTDSNRPRSLICSKLKTNIYSTCADNEAVYSKLIYSIRKLFHIAMLIPPVY